MEWAYAVTTVPDRFDELLPRTLASLAAGGFDKPVVFVDALGDQELPAYLQDYEVVTRRARVKTFCHWMLTAWELLCRWPEAERYAVFQDDFVTYRNLREYLESCEIPKDGYWNLYTFPENEKQFSGWYKSNQYGRGAVGTVFHHEVFRKIIAHHHMSFRTYDEERRDRAVDGAIVDSAKKQGISEYVHNPSLVQHTGYESSMGNKVHELSQIFEGEEFDATTLIGETNKPKAKPIKKTQRIGLVGYNTHSGLGELNRQLVEHCDIDVWLVKPHSKYKTQEASEYCDTIVCNGNNNAKIHSFLEKVDTVLFCEIPYYGVPFIEMCKARKKRIVCVPMIEWLPTKGWPQQVHQFVCPTQQCYDEIATTFPSYFFPWPVDLKRFKHVPRTKCERFLFINGRGGWNGRKGAGVIRKLIQIWPDIPLTIISQTKDEWPTGPNVEILPRTQSNADLYHQGDVLLCPHSVDGVGLEPMEAMACGMPVISTDGPPWNEIPALDKIGGSVLRRRVKRPIDWYQPSAQDLAKLCMKWHGQDISEQSQIAYTWAELRRWPIYVPEFEAIVRNGERTRTVPVPIPELAKEAYQ